MSRSRRRFTAEQSMEVVRRRLAGKEAALGPDRELGVQPSQLPIRVKRVHDPWKMVVNGSRIFISLFPTSP